MVQIRCEALPHLHGARGHLLERGTSEGFWTVELEIDGPTTIHETLIELVGPPAEATAGDEKHGRDQVPSQTEPQQRVEVTASDAEAPELPPLEGVVIDYDAQGRPTIARCPTTQRTVVIEDDGTLLAFGEQSVNSLMGSTEEDIKHWIDEKPHKQVRAFVHEVGQRLLEQSQNYHAKQKELERIAERLCFHFFGLTEEATEAELNSAYRSFSRRMHPDKNGGTKEANENFQAMKERYETLRNRLRRLAGG